MHDEARPAGESGPRSDDITPSAEAELSSGCEIAVIADSIAFIGRNHGDHLTLESVAERARMSKYHFSRLFHRTVGITFQDYVAKTRVMKAKELLRQTPSRSVTRIAIEVGFGTLRNMEKHFKSQVGLTPSQYRLRHTRRGATSFASS